MTRPTAPVVCGGRLRGMRLVVPAGTLTRPTRAVLREALFAMLGERVQGARVLDLYAGSGALGLEALSRGAAHCTFVEHAPRALAALRRNLESARLPPDTLAVLEQDCLRWAPLPDESFDLVLADPPYELRAPLPEALFAAGVLAAGARLALESASARIAPVALRGLHLLRQRTGGLSSIALYAHPDAPQP